MADHTDADAPGALRVVVVDPDPLARRVISEGLKAADGLEVVGVGTRAAEAVELAVDLAPDLMLMEHALPDLDGLDAVRAVTQAAPNVRLVLFANGVGPERELAVLRAGASGLLSKEVGVAGAIGALRGVARGEAAISRATTMSLIDVLRATPDAGTGIRPVRSNLTDREWEVLDLLSTGATTAEIAEQLVLSQETIYSHVKNIMRKLGVRSRADAIAAVSRLLQPLPAGA